MAGELREQIMQAANPLDGQDNQNGQGGDQQGAERKLSLQAQMLAGAAPEPGAQSQGGEEISSLTRYGTVYGKGLLRTPEGVLNTVVHYAHNPEEAALKAGFAATIGVGIRTILPKTGAGRAIVGTVMLGVLAKDLISPLIHAKGEADKATSHQELDQAATRLGNHMGMFTLDLAAGAYIGIKAEKLTGKILENPTSIAARFGERPRAFTQKHVEPRFQRFEAWKEKVWTSDEYFIGRNLNRMVAGVDRYTSRFKPKPEEKPSFLDSLTKEEKLAMMAEAQRHHAAAVDYHMMYKHGLKGNDGQYHGFDRTLDLLRRGLNPEEVASGADVSTVPYIKSPRLDEALAGLRETRDQFLQIQDGLESVVSRGNGRRAMPENGDGMGTFQGKVPEGKGRTGRGKTDKGKTDGETAETVKPQPEKPVGDKPEQPGGKPAETTPVIDEALEAKVNGEVNTKAMQRLAEVTEAERQAYTDEMMRVDAYKNEKIGQVDNSVNQNPVPLGPEHIPARNSMVKLGDEVQNVADVMQVKDLFDFFADASTQSQAYRLGPHQRLASELNLVGHEFMTFLVQSMRNAGIKEPFEVLQGKTPPLFAVSSDLVAMPNGKVVHAGPYTMRRIIANDPKTGEPVVVWGPDLVKYPLNMYGERSSSIGVYGHEIGHDWNGLIAKFLNREGEANVLTDAVRKALGPKYSETATVVGKDGAVSELVVGGKKWTKGELIESYLRATRDENTSDIIGTAWTGINMPLALARLLMGGRRNGNLMENSNVFSAKKMASPDNPLGFEVHAIDALRMVIGAKTIEYLGKGDPLLESQARSLMRLSREGSTKGEYELFNLDTPGQKIVIERDLMNNVVAELITAQMETPLSVLQGKTFGSILPSLRQNYPKMEALAEAMAKAIESGKDVGELIGDPRQFRSDYSITQVFGSGLPAELKLVQRGMDPVRAHELVNKYSDQMRSLYLEGDPHVGPLTSAPVQAIPMMEQPTRIASAIGRTTSNLISRQPELRWWTARNSAGIAGGAAANLTDDVSWTAKRLKGVILGSELVAVEQTRRDMLEGQR